MRSSKRDPDNAKIANAILRALADSDGLNQQQIRIAINAEPDEYRTINGILTSLGKRGEVSTVNGRYLLTPKGRRQLEPDASPPPVTSPGREAREPGPLWTQAETAALSDLRAAVERVGIQGRNLFVTCELLVGAREAIEVMEQRKEKAEEARLSIIETAKDGEGMQEQLSREVSDLIRALRSIEAALPGGPTGLRADAIADRAVGLLHGSVVGAREREALRQERDDAQRQLAEANERLAEQAIEKLRAAVGPRLAQDVTFKTPEELVDRAIREFDNLRNLHTESRRQRTVYREALKEIAAVDASSMDADELCEAAEAATATLRTQLEDAQDKISALHADLDKVNDENTALRAEVDTLRRAAPITGWGNAQTVELAIDVSRERAVAEASLAEAEAEIAALRGENAALRATAATDTDGHYWTEQGGRHVLAILRPVEVAVVLPVLNSETQPLIRWFLSDDSDEYGFAPTVEKARAHAELAAGVRS